MIGTWIADQYPSERGSVFIEFDGSYSLEVPEDCQSVVVCYEYDFDVPLGKSDTLNVIHAYAWFGKLEGKPNRPDRPHSTQVKGQASGLSENEKGKVTVKGTDFSVELDEKGFFSMEVPPGNDILVFSAEGHHETEVLLGDQKAVFISLNFYPVKKRKRWWQLFRRG